MTATYGVRPPEATCGSPSSPLPTRVLRPHEANEGNPGEEAGDHQRRCCFGEARVPSARVAARSRSLPAASVLFLIALSAAAHDAIEKLVLERTLAAAFGGDASIASLQHEDGLTIAEGVRVQTAGGSATLTAERVAYAVERRCVGRRPAGVHLTLAVDRLAGDELAGAPNAAHVLGIGRMAVHLTNATVTLTRSARAGTKLEARRNRRNARQRRQRLTYDVHGNVIADTGAYPFSANAVADGAGVDQHWNAAALPLAPLAALLAGVRPQRAATASRATSRSARPAGVRGTFTLDGVRASIAGHARARARPVRSRSCGDGVGSTGLDALLDDGTPVAAVGEVHDGADWGRILTLGNARSARARAHVRADRGAAEPALDERRDDRARHHVRPVRDDDAGACRTSCN